MLAHARSCRLRSFLSPCPSLRSRGLSASIVTRQDAEEHSENVKVGSSRPEGPVFQEDPAFEQWLNAEGRKYEHPRPRNWIGGDVPFPLNPTFKPPTPVSDRLRTIMYNEFMSDPQAYNPRMLSERYGISIKRVDAILRLKGLEEHWLKKKQLQTGFLAGMEDLLGVTERDKTIQAPALRGAIELGDDASSADTQMNTEGNARARERYQRLFWELVTEGQKPVIPTELERARIENRRRARAEAEIKAARAGVPPRKHEELVVDVPGRPTVKFVDVGGKFVDVDDHVRRLKESDRRSRLREKRRARKEEAAQAAKQAKAVAA